MIADWTVDAELESPRIVVPWTGWVDLRTGTANIATQVHSLAEVQAFPELAELLIAANTAGMMTVKVDVFPVSHEEVDPEILEDAWGMDGGDDRLKNALIGFGNYLDIVLVPDFIPALIPDLPPLEAFSYFEQIARSAVRIAKTMEHRLGCAEIVVRPTQLYDRDTFGWTLYAIGFGEDETAARTTWAPAAISLVAALGQALAGLIGSTGE